MKLAIVASRFNDHITSKLFEGCMARLKELDITVADDDISWVPGAFEIPLIAKRYAATGHYAAVICLGAVIRGETSHYDYVCQEVSRGCMKVGLKYNTPVIFGVLTTENDTQALDRVGGAHGHKGRDMADAAVAMQHVYGAAV